VEAAKLRASLLEESLRVFLQNNAVVSIVTDVEKARVSIEAFESIDRSIGV
jgi:hypothetical protein